MKRPPPPDILASRVRREAIVTLKTGDAFRGVVNEQDQRAIVLCSASLVDPQSDSKYVAANGEVVILVADIAYLQFI